MAIHSNGMENKTKGLTEKQWAYRHKQAVEAHRRYEERLDKLFYEPTKCTTYNDDGTVTVEYKAMSVRA